MAFQSPLWHVSLRARLAAHRLHAQVDSRDHTEPARRAFMNRFKEEVDRNHLLPDAEVQRRAEYAKKAHFTWLALRSPKPGEQSSDATGY